MDIWSKPSHGGSDCIIRVVFCTVVYLTPSIFTINLASLLVPAKESDLPWMMMLPPCFTGKVMPYFSTGCMLVSFHQHAGLVVLSEHLFLNVMQPGCITCCKQKAPKGFSFVMSFNFCFIDRITRFISGSL